MNIFCDSGGKIFHVDPEKVYQGSVGVNTIKFIGQFPTNAQVLMAFKLPDGTFTSPKPMTLVTGLNKNLLNAQDDNSKGFSVWEGRIGATPKIDPTTSEIIKAENGNVEYDLDYAITQHFGQVTMQFYVYGAGAPGCLTTETAEFTVLKGVPVDVVDFDTDESVKLLTHIQNVVSTMASAYNALDDSKLDKTGGTMTGDLLMGDCNVVVESHGDEARYGNHAIIYSGQHGSDTLEFPTKSGTIALIDDIPAVVKETIKFVSFRVGDSALQAGSTVLMPNLFTSVPQVGYKFTATCVDKNDVTFLLDGEVETITDSGDLGVKILSIKELGKTFVTQLVGLEDFNLSYFENLVGSEELFEWFPIDAFSKAPNIGDKFTAICRSKDEKAFVLDGEVALFMDATNVKIKITDIQNLGNAEQIEWNIENINQRISALNINVSNVESLAGSNTAKLLQVEQIAKGAQQAISFDSYEDMVNALNAADRTAYNVGQSIYIRTLDVPDVWISHVSHSLRRYTYTSDEDIVNKLKAGQSLNMGYYRISQLEQGKVNLDFTKVTSNGETLSTFDLDSYTQNINKELNAKLSAQGGKVDGPLDVQDEVIANYFQTSGISYRDDGIYQGDYTFYIPDVEGTGVVDTQFDELLIKSLTENANTLTDEEKAKACEWLGADKKGVLYYSGGISLVNGVPISSKTIPLDDFNITPRAGDLVITSDGYLYEVFAVYPEGSFCTISYLTTLKYTLSESDRTEIKNSVLEALPYYTGEITVEDDA